MQRQSLLNYKFQTFGFIVQVGTEGQLLLWSNSGLDEWMFALREAVNRSKGRREALRKSQTLLPSMTGGGIWNRYKLHLVLIYSYYVFKIIYKALSARLEQYNLQFINL